MALVKFLGTILCVLAASFLLSDAQTQRRRFVEGSAATLQCSWSGLEDQDLIKVVRWFRKGIRLRSKRYSFDQIGHNYTITINDIQKKDRGTYVCSPKLDIDMVLEDGQFLVEVVEAVLPDAPDITETQLSEGGSGSLNCNYKVAKERHNLELFWTRNGNRMRGEEGSVSSMSDSTYSIYTDKNGIDWIKLSSVDVEAAGIYSCNYRYSDGRVFTMSFNVTVEEREDPADVERDITMKEDYESGRLMCNVSNLASQMRRFYWEKGGEELMEGDKYEMTETSPYFYTLKINMLDADEDEGVYRCVADLKIYSLAVRFNVDIIKSTKSTDFTNWTEFSVCDKQGKKYRFRTCDTEGCLEKYGYVYEVDSESCSDMVALL